MKGAITVKEEYAVRCSYAQGAPTLQDKLVQLLQTSAKEREPLWLGRK